MSYQVCSWVANFLPNRTQGVVLDEKTSDKAAVTSGVPQGSVLAPALFLFYIDGLPTNVVSTTRLFADDTMVYSTDGQQLQQSLAHLETWAKEWKMEFNAIKSEHILF